MSRAGAPGAALVTVIGIGEDGWDGLGPDAREALRSAPLIVGSKRQLALMCQQAQPELGVRCELLPSPLLDGLDELIREHPGLCMLASGDPMLHGIGATLARRVGVGQLRVLPGVSSVALACARLGWPEHETDVVSLVARAPETVLAALRPGARVLVLCRDGATPGTVARLLAERGWGASELTVLERLGGPAERVLAPVRAADLSPEPGEFDAPVFDAPVFDALNVLAVRPVAGREVAARSRLPGLPDDAFETDGQLTRRELRVQALSALRPGPGELLWDVGAGSGSIGIEWLRAEPLARALAIESRPDRADRVARNAAALGVPDLVVVRGAVPAALDGLPDAVFVGGGLTAGGVLEACWDRLAPGGRLVAHAVTVESEALLHGWRRALAEQGQGEGQLIRVAVSYLEPLGGFTTWRPALPIVQCQFTKGQITKRQVTKP